METKLTQEEGWCAGEIDAAITMHGWDELMKVRAEWLPKIGEEGWKKAFASCGEAVLEQSVAATDFRLIKEGFAPETDPDVGSLPLTVPELVKLLTKDWPADQKAA